MSEYVMVPVPPARVIEVYALLAKQSEEHSTEAPHSTPPVMADWSDELIERAYRESPPAMKLILEHLSLHPDEDITAEELSIAIGRTRQQQAGVLGAWGRRVKNRYSQGAWPFLTRWDNELSMMVYNMDSRVSDVIRRYL